MTHKTKNRLIYTAIIVAILSSTVYCKENAMMPKWFWETPIIPGVGITVGYANIYGNIQSSYEEAYEDAAWRLFIDKSCRIYGARITSRIAGETISFGNNFKIEFDSTGFDSFSKSLFRLDSIITNEMVLMLVGTANSSINNSLSYGSEEHNIGIYQTDNEFAAIGISPKYHFFTSCWREAEWIARTMLALSVKCYVKGEQDFIQNAGLLNMAVETDVVLSNIRTVSRGYNKDKSQMWVIVTVRRNDTSTEID